MNVTYVSRRWSVINIRELAKLAGVSIATVSRVINNPQLVQPDTREQVLEVMRRVNYTPAWTVESRLSSRSRLIAFLFSEADYYFYSDIRSGLESIAGLRGYTVLFCPTCAEPQRRSQQLRTLLGLRSASFTVEYQKGVFTVEVLGYGHGVGLSQYGAQYLAQHGKDYRTILAHYYPGTQLCAVG